MRKFFKLITALAFVASSPAAHPAAPSVVFDYTTEFSGGQPPAGPVPWLRATFADLSGGTVQLTLDALGLVGTESIKSAYFNLDPDYAGGLLTFNHVSDRAAAVIEQGTNLFKADGNGYYDIRFTYPLVTAPLPFTAGLTSVYNIVGDSTLVPQSFAFHSAPGGKNGSWFAAAQVQNIGGVDQGSGWVGAGVVGASVTAIPEPEIYAMLAAGLGLMGFVARRRRQQVAA